MDDNLQILFSVEHSLESPFLHPFQALRLAIELQPDNSDNQCWKFHILQSLFLLYIHIFIKPIF